MEYFIYKISCKNTSVQDCYVGHTKNFSNRKKVHKCYCNKGLTYPVYNFIRENGGWQNWDMEIIEIVNCENRMEASEREAFWCNQLKASLNKYRPNHTWDKNAKSEYNKNYYQQRKNRINNL